MQPQWALWLVALQLAYAQEVYDVFFGKPVTDRRRDYMIGANSTSVCTMAVDRCKVEDGRRVDGTCTNPKYPIRGATFTPFYRVLPARFGPGNSVRPAKDGSDLPSTRVLRTNLLPDGYVIDHPFTQLASHYFVFSITDSSALDDILKYAVVSDCCVGNTPNRVNPNCIAIAVPDDDPYLRLFGVRCLNLTRATTFQSVGCIPNTLPLERLNRATPLLDLSVIYGNTAADEQRVRLNEDGLLKFERRGNREIPPGNAPICINNQAPIENTCYQYGDFLDGNSLIGTNLPSLWFYREHNRLARKLKDINPCWDDQKIFQIAKDINIATHQHTFYYELMVEILGKKNALQEGVVYETDGYVNDFDVRYEPGQYIEYVQAARWFHTFQNAQTDLYDKKGKYLGTRKTVLDEFRSGILEINDTESQLTQGSFRQQSAKFDYTVDPDLSERLLGNLNVASDLMSIDMMRNRDFGFPPYNEYRKACGLPMAKEFEDFKDTIDQGRVEKLSRLYDDVDDVEFTTAVYIEKLIKGGWVGPTLYCVLVKNLLLWRKSDLFFFEHGDHPASLTLPQLNEIRKYSIAKLVCNNGDNVDMIQPKAFLQIGPGNKMMSCKEIPDLDLNKWEDPLCFKDNNRDGYEKNNIQDEKKDWASYLNVNFN